MKTPRIVDAMNYIDDDLVSSAVTYTRPKRKWWTNWRAIAACFAVMAILFGTIPFLKDNSVGSPFILTAYVAGTDDNVSTSELKEGEHSPVTKFEASNGLWGFVFSYSVDDFEQPISISIINGDQQLEVDENIAAITGIEMKDNQKYIFFIPPQNDEGPYQLPLTIQDEESNTVALITLLIEQSESGYVTSIYELTSYPRKIEQ